MSEVVNLWSKGGGHITCMYASKHACMHAYMHACWCGCADESICESSVCVCVVLYMYALRRRHRRRAPYDMITRMAIWASSHDHHHTSSSSS